MNDFKAGDKVYFINGTHPGRIYTLQDNGKIDIAYPLSILSITFNREGKLNANNKISSLVHATQETYEALCMMYPKIDWEKPKKVKTPSELIQSMLDDGYNSVLCTVSDSHPKPDRTLSVFVNQVNHHNDLPFVTKNGQFWRYARPYSHIKDKFIIDYINGKEIYQD